jgi:hypothetical protein
MKEERRTSETPYKCVVSIKSSENAMPGNTLEVDLAVADRKTGAHELGEENQSGRRYDSVVPCVFPVAPIIWTSCANVVNDSPPQSFRPAGEMGCLGNLLYFSLYRTSYARLW